jgi:CheY-like chemotaxis protein
MDSSKRRAICKQIGYSPYFVSSFERAEMEFDTESSTLTLRPQTSLLFGWLLSSIRQISCRSRKPSSTRSLQTSIPRILLAEDNVVNKKLAVRLLHQMGYRTDLASNGLETIDSLERQTYDVVLMDVQMPEMDGLEATRQIRQLTTIIQPHIIAMTANAMEDDREICLAAGMDDYVSKPIRVNELVGALLKAERR